MWTRGNDWLKDSFTRTVWSCDSSTKIWFPEKSFLSPVHLHAPSNQLTIVHNTFGAFLYTCWLDSLWLGTSAQHRRDLHFHCNMATCLKVRCKWRSPICSPSFAKTEMYAMHKGSQRGLSDKVNRTHLVSPRKKVFYIKCLYSVFCFKVKLFADKFKVSPSILYECT